MIIKKKLFSKLFKEEDSRFLLACGLKFSGIYLIIAALLYYVMWVVLSINNFYFESRGFLSDIDMRIAFFDNALQVVYAQAPSIMLFFILLFAIGVYIGKMLLRPFQTIGRYCDAKVAGDIVAFTPDTFSDYKLMTRFADFFFHYLDRAYKEKKIEINAIPSNFRKIHSPVFERVFFFHFSLFIGIIGIIACSFTYFLCTEVHSELVNLAIGSIEADTGKIGYFLKEQQFVFDSMTIMAFIVIVFSYTILSLHLYSKVSGPIFGFFTTMRSFMKGNSKARIHLLGYTHVRPHSRSFNKYLDFIERECSRDEKIVK